MSHLSVSSAGLRSSGADRRHVSVAVLGGGPAGSTAARLLATWGHDVWLFDRPAKSSLALVESLPPSTRKLFSYIGLADRIETSDFAPTRGNTAWWGQEGARFEPFDTPQGAFGFQVPRAAFDHLLLDAARERGVKVLGPARRVTLHAGHVQIEHDGGQVDAALVVDATGRAGLVARQGWRTPRLGPQTLALVGVWRRPGGFGIPDWTHTLVESFASGWIWSVPFDQERRQVTVMVNADSVDTTGGLTTGYHRALRHARHVSRLLEGAALEATPWVRDASVYGVAAEATGCLLAGDAASFIDPISSMGVKKAITSGWRAAVAANTVLRDQSRATLALDYHLQRERAVFRLCLAQAQRYFALAHQAHPHDFWAHRVDAWAGEPGAEGLDDAEIGVGSTDRVLLHDPAVKAAWTALKASPGIRLRVTPDAVVVRRPGIEGHEVVWQEAVTSARVPTGIGFIGRVNVPRLVALAPGYREVPALFGAYVDQVGEVSLSDFLGALSVALGKGLVQNQLDY